MSDTFRKNLIQERKTQRVPTPPDGPPPTRLRLTAVQDDPIIAQLATVAEQAGSMVFNPFIHPTLCVHTDDLSTSEFLQQCPEDTLRAVQTAAGFYYNTAIEVGGGWLWKSVEPREIIDQGGTTATQWVHIYIFRADDGWYGADAIWETKQQRQTVQKESEIAILFWSEASASFEDAPMMPLHFPWWSASEADSVSVVSGHQAFEQAITKNVENVGAAKSSTDGGKGGWKIEPSRGKGGHGGWMPRCATLISCYENSDYVGFETVVADYKKNSSQLRKLLGTD